MNECVFCRIVSEKTSKEFLAQTKNVLAFYDKEPSADVHILIIPKIHIDNFQKLSVEDHKEILKDMIEVSQQLIRKHKLDNKYKLVINGGEYQFVPHLHMHLMSGEMKGEI